MAIVWPVVPSQTTHIPPIFCTRVLTAPQILLALRIMARLLQLAAWLLLTTH